MLGNTSAIAVITDPETGVKTRHRFTNIEQSTSSLSIAEPDLFGQMRDVVNLWRDMSDAAPGWIESDDEALTAALRAHFQCGARPADWEHVINGPPATKLIEVPAAAPVSPAEEVPTEEVPNGEE